MLRLSPIDKEEWNLEVEHQIVRHRGLDACLVMDVLDVREDLVVVAEGFLQLSIGVAIAFHFF